jgi:hypothetical protein
MPSSLRRNKGMLGKAKAPEDGFSAGSVPASVAGTEAVLASLTSVLVNLPIVARLSRNRTLTRRIAWTLVTVVLLGLLGVLAQRSLDPLIASMVPTL